MTSRMRQELTEIPDAVRRLLAQDFSAVAAAMRARDPAFLMTIARGSSDHACTYLKYASELVLGLPVASLGPSVASVYGARLRVARGAAIAVSQSGASPDIVAMTQAARDGGALTVAITNNVGAPLARAADHVIDLSAGPELSVAATKTFVTSAVAGLRLVAEMSEDAALAGALSAIPGALEQAVQADWSPFLDALASGSVYVLGRGPSWAMAEEAALKFKEVCQLHAESYSSAEVLHGPVSIVDRGFPILVLAAGDAAQPAVVEVADGLADRGASVFITSDAARTARPLPAVRTGHGLTDPLALIVSFYAMVEALAQARRMDPDAPRHLQKVTMTT